MANALARSFVVSVLPVPAGPAGAPPIYKKNVTLSFSLSSLVYLNLIAVLP